jgi:hypothetical protein
MNDYPLTMQDAEAHIEFPESDKPGAGRTHDRQGRLDPIGVFSR